MIKVVSSLTRYIDAATQPSHQLKRKLRRDQSYVGGTYGVEMI